MTLPNVMGVATPGCAKTEASSTFWRLEASFFTMLRSNVYVPASAAEPFSVFVASICTSASPPSSPVA